MLNKRQTQVLKYIIAYKEKNDVSPSLEEIKKHLGLSAVSTIHYHIQRLQDEGYLQKEFNQPRSTAPFQEVRTVNIPLLGRISAGQPIEAIENPDEYISVTLNEVGKSGQLYALRVVGNSMIDEGIFDGDIVVLRKQEIAENGQTVVAIVDEEQATLKKFYREKDRIRLQPANMDLFPIYRKEVEIRGVVIKVIRNLETRQDKERASDTKYQRKIDYSWDFRGEKTKSYTHGLHNYPAMFIPQVARRLLQTYSKEGDTVCDIFCGSGTTLVESRLLGRNAYGIDLNPFAIFLAKVKTKELNPYALTKTYIEIKNDYSKVRPEDIKRPEFNNLEFWFKEGVIADLSRLKKVILDIKDKDIKQFFMVAFSEVVRSASNTKNGEFKLVRIKKEKLEIHNPNVLELFKKKVESNIVGMTEYYKVVEKNTWVKPLLGDSSKVNGIKENSIDCIVTSPPYGDSRTTVAYGQFSRLSAQWVGIYKDPNDASGIDNELLGGRAVTGSKNPLKSSYLVEALEKISQRDRKRAGDVLSFFIGLEKCIRQAHKILKKNKYFCIVIGNRLVKQVRIPTDFIIAELAENIGFSTEEIIVRNIPGKRMPSKTSPTNIVGVLEETMLKESILILKKLK